MTLYTKINGSYQDGTGAYFRNSYTYTAMAMAPSPCSGAELNSGRGHRDLCVGGGSGRDRILAGCRTIPFVGNVAAGSVGASDFKAGHGLPTDGSTVYATLYTKINGSYQDSQRSLSAEFLYLHGREDRCHRGAGTELRPGWGLRDFAWPWFRARPSTGWMWGPRPSSGTFSAAAGAAPARQVTGLPTDGSTVYVTLYTKISGSFQDATGAYLRNSYVVTRRCASAPLPCSAPVFGRFNPTAIFAWAVVPNAQEYWLTWGLRRLSGVMLRRRRSGLAPARQLRAAYRWRRGLCDALHEGERIVSGWPPGGT